MNRWIAPVALLAVTACTSEVEYDGAFAVPSAGDATSSDNAFGEPIAYVASQASGLIQVLAAKQGRFLNDDPTAAYLRGNPLATGQSRTLSSVAAWNPSDTVLTVFAADQTHGHLLEIPHVTGFDDLGPIEPGVTVSDPVASGGGQLQELEVRAGYATTETWILTFDGETWDVRGSRSGRQELPATPDEPYTSSLGGVSFTVTGAADAGDTLTFDTDAGLVEHVLAEDLAPVRLAMAPDQSVLALTSFDDVTGAAGLHWWDPTSATLTDITLADGAQPDRMAWAGDTLYVADAATSGVWTLSAGETTATLLPLPWPVQDVAPAVETGRLFVVPVLGRSVWMADIETGDIIDVNPAAPGLDGMDLFSPVNGIATLADPVRYPSDDDDGVRRSGRVIAISLHRGPVVFMDQETGCLLGDTAGPKTLLSNAGGDHNLNVDTLLGPSLLENSSNQRHIIVNPCAGIARGEEWRAVYRAALQAWEVRGALSGVQRNLAYEDTRYISDRGEVSFLILGGADPSREGMSISFVIDEGVVTAFGDMNGDGDVLQADAEVSFANPADPIPVSFRVGPSDGGWRTVDIRSNVIVPLQGSDAVSRVDPATGLVDAVWR